jgi:hypothetical protein
LAPPDFIGSGKNTLMWARSRRIDEVPKQRSVPLT